MKRSQTLALLLAFALAGCAAHHKRDAVLERSADRLPDWAVKQTFEKDQFLFVTGEGTDSDGYALAGRIAKAAAVQNLVEVVGLRAKSELVRTMNRMGMATTGSFVQDSVALTTEMVTVQDLSHVEDYRDKAELAENGMIRYRVVSLYKLPVDEFKAAKVRALEAMQRRFSQSNDRAAADAAKKLLEEVKGE